MDVAKSQMEKKQTVRGGRSTSDPDMLKEINGIGPSFMVQLESKLKEILRLRRYVRGYSWLGGRTDLGNRRQSPQSAQTADSRTVGGLYAYLENGLHLTKLSPWMLAGQHLDDQTPHAPDVCLTCVRGLLYDFRCHPENRALQ